MTTTDWSEKDYYQAEDHLFSTDEESKTTPVVDCGEGVTALLPIGIPALGVRWQAVLVLAPLPMLMVWLVWILGMGLPGSTGNAGHWGIVALSLILMAGLIRVTLYLFNNRTLFPRKYFVTISSSGVAMHFSRTHFPLTDPRTALTWKEVKTVTEATFFFLPALLMLRPQVPCLLVIGTQGQRLTIPFRLSGPHQQEAMKEVTQIIQSRIKS